MYEVTSNTRRVMGVEVNTYQREIINCNILEVEAGTTGYRGGDAGHGGRTYFRIRDLASTAMEARVEKSRWGDTECIEVELGGDAELETIITALQFIVRVLDEQRREVHD